MSRTKFMSWGGNRVANRKKGDGDKLQEGG